MFNSFGTACSELKNSFHIILAIVLATATIAAIVGMVTSCYRTVTHIEAYVNDKVHDINRWTDKDGIKHKNESFYIKTDQGKYETSESIYDSITAGKNYRFTIRGWKGFQTIVDIKLLRDFDPEKDVKVE
jgi:hypothetical protein